MYASKSYVRRKEGRVPVVHYPRRREGQLGTCQIRQTPARVVEPLVLEELRGLSLDPQKLQELAGQAEDHFQGEVQPLSDRREHLVGERERLERKGARLLELAEDGLITKEEFAQGRPQLADEQEAIVREIGQVEADLRVREESALELHVPAFPLLLPANKKGGKTQARASSDTGVWQDGDPYYGVCERMDVSAGFTRTRSRNVPAPNSQCCATSAASPAPSWIVSTSMSRCQE